MGAVVGPVVYAWLSARVLQRYPRRKSPLRQVADAVGLVLVHSGVYAWVHRAMHRVKPLRLIHAYHHRYTTDVTPTVSNAVSPWEFLLAYLFPFALGSVLLRATEASLFAATSVVSALNLCVHSPTLARSTDWPVWMVHPREHLRHHHVRGPPYAAPTVSWKRQCDWLHMWMYR